MTKFMTFSEKEGELRRSVRVNDDGRVTVLVTGLHGEVRENIETTIDPSRARGLVVDAQLVAPMLASGGRGASLGVGEGEREPAIVSFDPQTAPAEATELRAQVCDLIAETLDGRPDAPSPDRRAVDLRGMSVSAFVLWTFGFMLGHVVAAGVGGLVLLVVLNVGGSLIGLVLGVLGIFAAVLFSYFAIGFAHGRSYGRRADAWKPAAAAIVIPALIVALGGGGFKLAALSFLLPLSARFGARVGGPKGSANAW